VRAPVDAQVRDALARAGVDYHVIYGAGASRTANALGALRRASLVASPGATGDATGTGAWVWTCEKCSDPECEHGLFRRLVAGPTASTS
jgi:hypothetical protein